MLPTIQLGAVAASTQLLVLLLTGVVGAILGDRQLRALGADPAISWRILPWAAAGGLLGAKLYDLPRALTAVAHDPLQAVQTLPSTWFGGIVGALLLAWWRARRLLPRSTPALADAAAPVVALSYALLRVGCFLNGDDYGVPTTGWTGVAFAQGAAPSTAGALRDAGVSVAGGVPDARLLAVHPTQLYEAALHVAFFAVLWPASRRAAWRPWQVTGALLVLHGLARIAVETLRVKSDRLAAGVTVTQLLSTGLVVAGAWLWVRARRTPTVDAPRRPGRATAS